jgi:energy-coupling factor transporter ATP-binding protein EcfA2
VTTFPERLEALRRFVSVSRPYLGSAVVGPASSVVDRAGDRVSLSLAHTVVALAGATGSGKSSLFNALAGVTLSPAGVRRPTTGSAYACVWSSAAGDAGPLLDWLKIGNRFSRGGPSSLDGLVLVDLPDFDSVEASHRLEVDRLLEVVDVIVWVLHPQKYADKVVHSHYLQEFAGHQDVTVVVLNAADLLSPADLADCLADLTSLLAEDGFSGVPVLTTSVVGQPGIGALTSVLATAVAERKAAVQRLSADLDRSVGSLSAYVGPSPSTPRDLDRGLADALSRAAGVPVVASAVEGAYVHRARKFTGWPPARWVRRFRPDPLGRLHLWSKSAGATSLGPAAVSSVAAAGLAVRDVAARASAELPDPWPTAVLDAARSRMDDLPDALDVAVSSTELGVPDRRPWWRMFSALQWIGTVALGLGVLWLLVRYILFALALPDPPMPSAGRLPLPTVLLFGGLLFGWVLALLARLFVRLAARRARRRAAARLHRAVERVAEDLILTPVRTVLTAYADARAALRAARR